MLLLEQGERLVQLAVVDRVGAEVELDERRGERLALVVQHRDVALPALVPEGFPAGRRLLDLGRVVGHAGRPPHVRHRVRVARVVARVRPFGAEVDLVRDERQVQRQDLVDRDEARDVGRRRERDVEAGLAGGDARVHPLVRVEEVRADLDVDLVVLLDLLDEGRDDVLAHVLGVVPDVELGLGHGRRRRRRGGRRRGGHARRDRRRRGRDRRRDGRGARRGAGGTRRDDRGERGEGTHLGDLLEQHPPGDPVLRHVPGELPLEVDAAVGSVVHDCSSSGAPGPRPRTSASDGDQLTATSLPTGSRTPVLGVMTVRSSPPVVRTRYEMVEPR